MSRPISRLARAWTLAILAMLACAAPAQAGFGLTKLHSGSAAGPENYAYTSGDAFTAEGGVDNGKWHRFVTSDPAGVVRGQTACTPNPPGGSITGETTYTVPPGAPPSTNKGWRYQLQQFTNASCTGKVAKAAQLYFTVARLSAFTASDLATPTTAIAPGAAIYLRVDGLGAIDTSQGVTSQTDWKVTWMTPSGTVSCANTGGGDRPDSSASGSLPSPAASFLMYRPSSTDQWNVESKYETRPCANTSAHGEWRLKLQSDATHFVTMDAFLVTVLTPVSITSAPSSPGSGRSPSWSFSGGSGTAYQCRLRSSDATISDWAACTSPHGYDLTGLPEDDYEFSVRATAGAEIGPIATSHYLLDTTTPDPPSIDDGPGATGFDTQPTWSFSAEVGASVECRLAGPGGYLSDWAPCADSAGYDLSAAADGTYTFSARATDEAGHVSAVATSDYVLDRSAPAVPVLTSHPLPADDATSVAWGFTSDPGTWVECRLERGLTVVSDWTVCTSPDAFDLAAEPDGTYTFSARAVDAAGNVGAPLTSTYVLDRVAPAAPGFTALPASPSPDASPDWEFSAEPGAALDCRVTAGATVVADWTPCASGQPVDLAAQLDGTYTFWVRATDAAGNAGPAASSDYVLDRTAPAAALITSAPASPGNATSVSWSFTGDPGSAFTCRVERGGAVIEDWAPCSSPQAVDLAPSGDGTYTFLVRATDGAGNTGAPASSSYVLDRVLPAAPTVVDHPLAVDDDATPTWNATGEPGSALQCRLEQGVVVVADWALCDGPVTYDLGARTDGAYTYNVRAVDAAGNIGPATTWGYTLDRDPPAPPSVTSAPASPDNDTSVSWSFSGEAGASYECRVDGAGGVVVSGWAPCTSPAAYDLAGNSDGSFTLSVRATDVAGNTGAAGTSSYVLDRTGPEAPSIDVAPPATGSDTTPTWDVSSDEPGATLECRTERDGALLADWAPCTSPYTRDLAATGDATYRVLFRARDAVGNAGAAEDSTYVLDRAADPAPDIVAHPATPGHDALPSWSFSGQPGSTFECRLSRGATVVDDWAPCTSPDAHDLAAQPDGSYTFSVRATDAAGNTGAAATSAYDLDRAAPGAPAIDSAPGSPGTGASPSWAFTAEAGATTECRLERGATVIIGWGPCTSPRAVDLSGEPDGSYTFSARATDAAGNTGAAATSTYTIDRIGPEAPAIDAGPPGVSSTPHPSWSFHGDGAAGGFTCRLVRETIVVVDWAPCADARDYDLSGQPDGTYTFAVRGTDGVGNVGAAASAAYVLDTTGSPAPALGPLPPSPSAGRAPAWTFSGQPGDTYECRLDRGPTRVADWAACTSPRGYDLTGEPDAGYTFMVRAIDAVGNAGGVAAAAYALDTTPPGPPKLTAPVSPGSDRRPQWTFTGEGGTLECRLVRGAALVADWLACTSPRRLDLRGQPDGDYTLGVRETDAAGNRSAVVSSRYRLDTEAPAAPGIDAPTPRREDDRRLVTFTFAGETGASFQCRLRADGAVVSDWADCTSPRTYDMTGRADGEYQFDVRATDDAGNVSDLGTQRYALQSRSASTAADPTGDTTQATPAAAGGPSSPQGPGAAPRSRTVAHPGRAPRTTRKAAKHPATHAAPARRPAPKPAASRPAPKTVHHREKPEPVAAAVKTVTRLARQATQAVARNADKSVFPASLIFLVVGFIGLQNRIDRGDPKLALAPITAEPELEFGPPPSLR